MQRYCIAPSYAVRRSSSAVWATIACDVACRSARAWRVSSWRASRRLARRQKTKQMVRKIPRDAPIVVTNVCC